MTPELIARTKRDWEAIAKETIEVEAIKGTLYGFGSELAVLRLFYAYNMITRNTRSRVTYSEARQTWTYCYDVRFQL